MGAAASTASPGTASSPPSAPPPPPPPPPPLRPPRKRWRGRVARARLTRIAPRGFRGALSPAGTASFAGGASSDASGGWAESAVADFSACLVGRRVSVAWGDGGAWYDAEVVAVRRDGGGAGTEHRVRYEADGFEEWVSLDTRPFRVFNPVDTEDGAPVTLL
jgi:hypothetical protein